MLAQFGGVAHNPMVSRRTTKLTAHRPTESIPTSLPYLMDSGPQRVGGKGGRLPQGLVLQGALDCKSLFLKNSPKCLKGLNPE